MLRAHYANRGAGKIPPGLSPVHEHYGQNFNGCTHIFEVHLFNGVVDDITGSRIIPEIDMAGTQTGSYRISICMTAINKSPTATLLKMDFRHLRKYGNICWNCSTICPAARDLVTSGLDVCDIYFRYKTTSYNTKLRTVELLDIENMGIAIGILLPCAVELEI